MVLLLFLLSCCPLRGQQSAKKHLSETDYDKWGTLAVKSISDQGKWTSYEMNYEHGRDTLFLQNTSNLRSYAYPKGKQGCFGGEKVFGYLKSSDLVLVSLKNGSSSLVKKVKRFELLNEGTSIVTQHTDSSLQVRNNKGTVLLQIANVSSYKMNPQKEVLIYAQKRDGGYAVGCIDFKNLKHSAVAESDTDFANFNWEEKGKWVVFSKGTGLVYYDLEENRTATIDARSLSDYKDAAVVHNGLTGLRISNDGERVFFSVAKTRKEVHNSASDLVEVWNGNDAVLYPTKQELEGRDVPKLVVWYPKTGASELLSNDALYRVRLTGNGNYVVLSNPYRYGMEPSYYEKVDYYIKNVATGTQQLFLQHQSHDPNWLGVAPYGDHIVYYSKGNWWMYNPDEDTSVNLTKDVATTWDNASSDAPKQEHVYGIAGWTSDGKSVLLYDAYDIWEVALNGKSRKRLTFGREQEKVYRINRMESEKLPSRAYDSGLINALNLSKPLLLDCSDAYGNTGYALCNKEKGVTSLIFINKHVKEIKRSSNGAFVFSTETFSQAPEVVFLEKDKAPKVLFQSNKQQVNYNYGRAELISFTSSAGTLLKGVLFYPADYEEGKQYPMIVQVYEKMAKYLHRYVNPSLLNGQGFVVTNYTLNGYFVLMPDIAYELGNPGISAANCITAAVNSVVSNYPIDSSKMGLIGHSFGGYETNFTITQTPLFAAAVSGAGVSDPIARYFEIGNNGGPKSEMWRFESQQFRMGSSFFSNKTAYWHNTPIVHTDQNTTPLLLWSGKEDPVVSFRQSISYYMALRRLGATTVLLAYPNEKHNLSSAVAQTDLSRRIRQWFDYYLKDIKEVEWIKEGTSLK